MPSIQQVLNTHQLRLPLWLFHGKARRPSVPTDSHSSPETPSPELLIQLAGFLEKESAETPTKTGPTTTLLQELVTSGKVLTSLGLSLPIFNMGPIKMVSRGAPLSKLQKGCRAIWFAESPGNDAQ